MAKKQSKKKRIGKRQNKMYKNPSSSSLSLNVEHGNTVEYTTSSYRFRISPNNQYIDVAAMLAGETTFTEMAARFSMYRINGLKIEARAIFEPSSNTNLEHQVVWLGFFPSVTGSYIGSNQVMNYDKSLITSTNQTLMSRKMTFYNNYFEGSGGGGYGTWNSVTTYSQIPGSIQIAVTTPRSSFVVTSSLIHVRFIFNVTFKEKQLTG